MWRDGIIRTDGGEVVVRPGMRAEEILASRLPVVKSSPPGLASRKIHLGEFRLDSYEVVAAVNFKGERLWFVSIVLSVSELWKRLRLTPEQHTPRSFYHGWIRKNIGVNPPASFPWGKIVASEDHWTLDTALMFSYLP